MGYAYFDFIMLISEFLGGWIQQLSSRWLSLAHLWKDASDFVPIVDEQQKF